MARSRRLTLQRTGRQAQHNFRLERAAQQKQAVEEAQATDGEAARPAVYERQLQRLNELEERVKSA